MQIAGIIAEYNPFHNGHAYHIQKAREHGATHVAVVLSGYFVQRGEPAAFSFPLRAEQALRGGADLVLLLPTAFSLSGTGDFGKAGVHILSSLGCDRLSFGAPLTLSALTTLLAQCAKAERSSVFQDCLSCGMHFPRARAQAVSELFGAEAAALLTDANTALSLRYMAENAALPAPMALDAVLRRNVQHDAPAPNGAFASASLLRRDTSLWESCMPYPQPFLDARASGQTPDAVLSERILLAVCKRLPLSAWESTAGVSEGLHNRIYAACRRAGSVEELLSACKSKRWTLSALRRILWCGALGITKEMTARMPKTVWAAASNERGYEILAKARRRRELLAVTPKFADYAYREPAFAEADRLAADLYALTFSGGLGCSNRVHDQPAVIE